VFIYRAQLASQLLTMATDSPDASGEMRKAFRPAGDHSQSDSLFTDMSGNLSDMSSNSLVSEKPPYPGHRKASAQDHTSVQCRLRRHHAAQLLLGLPSEQQVVGSILVVTPPPAASTEGGSKDTIVSL